MDHSTIVIGAIFAGFILYLAAANRLGVYVAILTGRVQQSTGTSAAAPAATSSSGAGGLLGGLVP